MSSTRGLARTIARAELAATSTTAAWPEGVIARYLTVGGATVDLTHRLTVVNPPEPFATLAACTACPAREEFSHWQLVRGMYADREEHAPDAADEQARTWAQAHADKCRAMLRPAA